MVSLVPIYIYPFVCVSGGSSINMDYLLTYIQDSYIGD